MASDQKDVWGGQKETIEILDRAFSGMLRTEARLCTVGEDGRGSGSHEVPPRMMPTPIIGICCPELFCRQDPGGASGVM